MLTSSTIHNISAVADFVCHRNGISESWWKSHWIVGHRKPEDDSLAAFVVIITSEEEYHVTGSSTWHCQGLVIRRRWCRVCSGCCSSISASAVVRSVRRLTSSSKPTEVGRRSQPMEEQSQLQRTSYSTEWIAGAPSGCWSDFRFAVLDVPICISCRSKSTLRPARDDTQTYSDRELESDGENNEND